MWAKRYWCSIVIPSPLTHWWKWCNLSERDWTSPALCCITSIWWNCWPAVLRARMCTRKSSVTAYFRWMISSESSRIRIVFLRWEGFGGSETCNTDVSWRADFKLARASQRNNESLSEYKREAKSVLLIFLWQFQLLANLFITHREMPPLKRNQRKLESFTRLTVHFVYRIKSNVDKKCKRKLKMYNAK